MNYGFVNKRRFVLRALVGALVVSAILLSVGAQSTFAASKSIVKTNKEMRAVWVSCFDFGNPDIENVSREDFEENYTAFLKKAKDYGINTVMFHVRAYDDAVWKSSTFNASRYLVGTESAKKKAKDVYSFDPLKVVIKLTHKYGMELHAWFNPFRTSEYTVFYDPGKGGSVKRVLKAVKEVLKYNVDGIHFDDYFYNAAIGYTTVKNPNKIYSIISKKGEWRALKKYKIVPVKKKQRNINTLVRSVYKLCHKKKRVFGISPQGDVENCLNAGANVKTWMKNSGYVDYIVPQLYWSDKYGTDGTIKEFTKTLNNWMSLNKNNTKMYVGLALYKAGRKISWDPGWKKSNKVIANQVKKLRENGITGFVLFSGADFYSDNAQKELRNLKKYLNNS